MGKRFCVFALPLSEENITYAQKQIFSMVSPTCVLVYTSKKRVKGGHKLKVSELNQRDQAWIQTCQDKIVQDILENDAETGERMMRFLDCFAEELGKIKNSEERGEQNIGTESREANNNVRQDAPTV